MASGRISVISFVGLPSDEQRQGFVNQLQMEVFGWIKRNPAGDRPLGGLFVMDEAQTLAPAVGSTASTASTIILASQARKYGLGLLFATQAPKGLHNQIIGNATTQFFGRLNSPAQIAAAIDMARAKGSTIAGISALELGNFYVTGEGFGFRRLRAPMCLSHHPPGPLRLEDVVERARNV
jgi:DNA helicase HerA-like ATPase